MFWAEAGEGGWPFVACAGKDRDEEMLARRANDHPDVKDFSPPNPGEVNPKCEAITHPDGAGVGGSSGGEGGSSGGGGNTLQSAMANLWLVTHPWVSPLLSLMGHHAIPPMPQMV